MPEIRCNEHGWIRQQEWQHHQAAMHPAEMQEQVIRNIETTKAKVKYLLERIPATRSNDKLLYSYILRNHELLIYDAKSHMLLPRSAQGWTFEEWLAFPSYETVRRARQKIQEEHKELRASDKVATERMVKEKAYRAYYGNTYVPDSES